MITGHSTKNARAQKAQIMQKSLRSFKKNYTLELIWATELTVDIFLPKITVNFCI